MPRPLVAYPAIFVGRYNKLVQKSFGRYLYQDYLRRPTANAKLADFAKFAHMPVAETYSNKDFLKQLADVSKEHYHAMVQPSELITKQCGNSYCGSLYAGILSLVANKAAELPGKRALCFSYGSGLAATLFSLQFKGDVTRIRDTANVAARLKARHRLTAQEFTDVLELRERTHLLFDHEPHQPVSELTKGTYYLSKIDLAERRFYARAYHTAARPLAAAMAAAPAAFFPSPRLVSLAGAALRVSRRLLK